MSFLFEPVSAAIDTLKYIKSASDKGPDPNRFVTRTPPNPGKWALSTAFKRQHNLWKWTHYLPSKVPRKQQQMKARQKQQESLRIKLVARPTQSEEDTVDRFPDEAPQPKASAAPQQPPSDAGGVKLPRIEIDGGGQASIDGKVEPLATSSGPTATESTEMPTDSRKRKTSGRDSAGSSLVAETPLDEDGLPYFPIADDDEADAEARKLADMSPEQRVYHRSCEHFKLKPCRQVMKQIDSSEMVLAHTQLRDMEFKAITTSLVMNFTVKRLDITGMSPSERTMTYLNDFLEDDNGITDLILKDNRLEGRMFHRMFDSMRHRDVMVYVDISGNNLRDKDLSHLATYIESSSQLSYFHMAKNKFTSKGGEALGKMMANASLLELNISSNQIRGDGMIAFLNGIARNSSLERLDVSWNGIGPEAVKSLCNVIKNSGTLNSLDLAGTRINGECLDLIYTQGLAKNTVLQRLELQNNPLLTSDYTLLFTRLVANQSSGIRRMDLGDYQMLDSSVQPIVEQLFWERNVDIRSGPFFTSSKYVEATERVIERFKQDPLALVARLSRSQRNGLVKHFSRLDQDEAIETGTDIPITSFLGRVNENRVTYKDLAQRIKKEGGNPRDVIRAVLDKLPDTPSARKIVSRLTIGPEEARKKQLSGELTV